MAWPERSPDDAACVQQWLARDPALPRRRSVEEWARFDGIRELLLQQLRRDVRMWLLQGGNVLRGLMRYALVTGLFLALVPPVLVFWEPFLWPVADTPPRLPLPAPEGAPALWHGVVIGLLGLVLLDILLGCRLSRFRNVFVEKAERVAWAVVTAEPSAGAGTAPRRPGVNKDKGS
jgi:hypothetical protein